MPYTILYKTKLFFPAILITILTCIISLNSYAQEEKKERGKNGRITKVELFDKLKKLKGDEYVDGYIINGSDIITIIKESKVDIKIRLSIIEGGLDFSRLPEVNGKREVDNKIEILNSEVESSTGTSDVNQCELSVYTEQNYFNKNISFRYTTFNGGADFMRATFIGMADFRDVIFSGKTGFKGATFSGEALFWYVTFGGEADFKGATFSRKASFRDAIFNGEANLWDATFNKLAFFRGARFFGEFILRNTLFKEHADLRDTRIRRLYYKGYTITAIGAHIDLRGTWITEAHFENIIFEKDVDFSDVEFNNLFMLFSQ